MKVLLSVDGSEPSVRATRKLIETLHWYKEPPQIEVLNVHLPVPHVGGMHSVISEKDVDRYYGDEAAAELATNIRLLDEAGVKYAVTRRVGAVADTIVEHARQSGSDLIYMGTHGRRAASAIVFGSVTMEVLRLATIPVVLVR